jgi:hypothetical protein
VVPSVSRGCLDGPCLPRLPEAAGARRDLFRTVAAASGAGSEPGARKLWEGKVIRSFDRDPRSRERLAAALRPIDWHTRAGLYLGTLVGLEGDRERIGNVLRKIVRGLSYLERGRTVMPFDVDWNYSQESPLTGRPPEFVMEMFHGLPLRSVGAVVRYKFALPPEEPRVTLTWMAFYGRTMFTVWTGPKDPSELDRLIASADPDSG